MVKIFTANSFEGYLLEISKPIAPLSPLPQKLSQVTISYAGLDISHPIAALSSDFDNFFADPIHAAVNNDPASLPHPRTIESPQSILVSWRECMTVGFLRGVSIQSPRHPSAITHQ